jgi:hypothetical protein
MFKATLLAATSLGLLAAACAGPYDRQAPVPSNTRTQSLSERNCFDYGFTPGSAAFDRCVQREARARNAGRVNRDYAEARLLEDARNACFDYGLERNTPRFDNCVTREVEFRRYRSQSEMPAPSASYIAVHSATRTPTPDIGYRAAATSTDGFRDEFGNRYDGNGNGLDRDGRIVNPQSSSR